MSALKKYNNAHLWLLIPFAIVMLGFLHTFWLKFSAMPWRQHLHGLTATLWFILLIVQPYLMTRGHSRQHKLYGMIAVFLAGGVAISALNQIPHNLVNEGLSDAGKYGLTFINTVLITGFIVAVLMAVKTARKINDHPKWMISTAFWAVPPALFRVLLMLLKGLKISYSGSEIALVWGLTGMANIVALSVLMFRDKRTHPAYLSAAIGSLAMFVPLQVGAMQWWISIADSLFTLG